MIKRIATFLLSCLLAMLVLAIVPPTARANFPNFVKIEGSHFTLNGQKILIKGSTYYQRNAPWAEMWKQWYGPQVAEEVAMGREKLGVNVLRIMIPYGVPLEWNDPKTGQVNPEYFDDLHQMVEIAGRNNMRILFTLFDFYSGFDPANTPEEATNRLYIDTIVGAFKDDDRILGWDVHNEPDNYGPWKQGKQALVTDWLERTLAYIKQVDRNHPVTIGMGNYDLWNYATPSGKKLHELVDFISLHTYEAPNMFQHVQELQQLTKKPILIEEAGWPTGPTFSGHYHPTYTEYDQLLFYERVIDVAKQADLAGVIQWQMLDFVAGRRLRATDITDYMGLLRQDNSLKPAGTVYAKWQAPALPSNLPQPPPRFLSGKPVAAKDEPLWFPQTQHWATAEFKRRWLTYGGLDVFGMPLTEPYTESTAKGTRMVQIFERAQFELNLESRDEPGFDKLHSEEQFKRIVRIRLLGIELTQGRNFAKAEPFKSNNERWYFPETGYSLSYGFRYYWLQHGGLEIFGYPISDELSEISPTDGKLRTVQYFERARFEYHPDLKGTPYETQLGQLGRELLLKKGWQ
jgi:Cellulase (glycosyl hydrolase family 5)